MVVVVVHLSPEHGSNIDAILGRVTPMPVRQVRQSVPIASDYVYVISPGTATAMGEAIQL